MLSTHSAHQPSRYLIIFFSCDDISYSLTKDFTFFSWFLSLISFKLWIWFRLSLSSLSHYSNSLQYCSFNFIYIILDRMGWTDSVINIRNSTLPVWIHETRAHANDHFGRCLFLWQSSEMTRYFMYVHCKRDLLNPQARCGNRDFMHLTVSNR